MKPLILLLTVFAIASVFSKLTAGEWHPVWSGNLAMFIMLCFTAMGHFKFTEGMMMMVPPFIPLKKELIYLTAFAEVGLGIALLLPPARSAAGFILIGLLVLMLPANIYAAINGVDYEKANLNGPRLTYLWFRVPIQLFLIVWVYYFSIYSY